MSTSSSNATGELIIVHQECRASRRQARAHLAYNGFRRRIQQQRARDNGSLSPPASKATVNPCLPASVPLSGFSIVEYLISTNILQDLSSTWGVSPAVCPGPANLSHSLSRASDVLESILRANLAFHWVDFNSWTTAEQKRNMKIAALTYRGQAIELAQKELFRCRESLYIGRGSPQLSSSQTDREIAFGIVLRLLQLDYRFARSDVHSHFAACRQLLRGSAVDSPTQGQNTIEHLASIIRNPHLHHLMITFESINCTPDSVIWDDTDLIFLTRRLYEFVNRLNTCNKATMESTALHDSHCLAPPRVSPSTIVWRCLTKKPASLPSNIYRDVSESSAQIGALLLICSVFLDYEEDGADVSIPYQCVEDLENALFALGEEDAVSSALNTAWLLAGGLGLPLTHRRTRLWSVSGMLYALKRSSLPNFTVVPSTDVVDVECIKQVCLEFLRSSGQRS
ncbi:hypothetical protein BDV28DRAFT_43280 [Aspergillus coremiiformis]|uniref:Uncharacterized protein n=1 Tax=Aspergillus coremiiformis TaxID=138285 RepID=A0A5N6Z050_9EURO|nr:hypothetical protein BDV28DRAFT_43280 [Aspergillus coremiiformis]